MATTCKLIDLTPDQVRLIHKLLTLIPTDPLVEERKKYKYAKQSRYAAPATRPIIMYQLFSSAPASPDDSLRIPFFFAKQLLGPRIQFGSRPRIINDNVPEFEAHLRDYQVEPSLEALALLNEHSTVTLGLPPGWGKTIIGAWLAYLTGLITLVYVHRDTLVEQWVRTFIKCIPKLQHQIWIPGQNELPDGVIPAIIICMDTRYTKIPSYVIDKIGTLIVDEAHLFCTPGRVGCLLAINPQYVIMETATMTRADGMHSMAQSIAGLHGVYRVSKTSHSVLCVETGVLVPEIKTTRGVSFTELCKSLASVTRRNQIIVDIVKHNLHRKFIILTRLSEHVKLLQSMLAEVDCKSDTLYRSKSSYSDSPVLIGTVPKIGTGFDEENACADFQGRKSDVLILAHSVKDWRLYEQLRGRVMRSSSPIIVWLQDRNPMVRRHFRGLEPWIAETCGTIVKVYYDGSSIINLPRPPAEPKKSRLTIE